MPVFQTGVVCPHCHSNFYKVHSLPSYGTLMFCADCDRYMGMCGSDATINNLKELYNRPPVLSLKSRMGIITLAILSGLIIYFHLT